MIKDGPISWLGYDWRQNDFVLNIFVSDIYEKL